MPPLHLVEQAGTVSFVPDLECISVGDISLAERIVKHRGDKIANGLFDDAGNRLPLGARDRLRVQSVEDHHALARGDDTAIEQSAFGVLGEDVMAGNDLPQASRIRRPIS